jgi:hypothetical protein
MKIMFLKITAFESENLKQLSGPCIQETNLDAVLRIGTFLVGSGPETGS